MMLECRNGLSAANFFGCQSNVEARGNERPYARTPVAKRVRGRYPRLQHGATDMSIRAESSPTTATAHLYQTPNSKEKLL